MDLDSSGQERGAVNFDAFAGSYEATLEESISLSGESASYFTRLKVDLLCRYLRRRRCTSGNALRILDYGCGTGRLFDFLLHAFPDVEYVGLDPSIESIRHAKARDSGRRACWGTLDDLGRFPAEHFTQAICAVVLHHIPVSERRDVLRQIQEMLAPGGTLFVFEHNPWNLLTRRVVERCPFDADAVLLSARECRQLLLGSGFSSVAVHYYFFFPRSLSLFRPIEPLFSRLPIGAQYLAIGLKA